MIPSNVESVRWIIAPFHLTHHPATAFYWTLRLTHVPPRTTRDSITNLHKSGLGCKNYPVHVDLHAIRSSYHAVGPLAGGRRTEEVRQRDNSVTLWPRLATDFI